MVSGSLRGESVSKRREVPKSQVVQELTFVFVSLEVTVDRKESTMWEVDTKASIE